MCLRRPLATAAHLTGTRRQRHHQAHKISDTAQDDTRVCDGRRAAGTSASGRKGTLGWSGTSQITQTAWITLISHAIHQES